MGPGSGWGLGVGGALEWVGPGGPGGREGCWEETPGARGRQAWRTERGPSLADGTLAAGPGEHGALRGHPEECLGSCPRAGGHRRSGQGGMPTSARSSCDTGPPPPPPHTHQAPACSGSGVPGPGRGLEPTGPSLAAARCLPAASAWGQTGPHLSRSCGRGTGRWGLLPPWR